MAFVKVAKAAEIPAGASKLVSVDGREIALFQVDGKFYALDNVCTHMGGPLADGMVQGLEVECPWHGARFHLETGQVTAAPAGRGVGCYPIRREGEDIEVEVG